MDRREDRALNDVERMTDLVERLRGLLRAATRAELQANSKRPAADLGGRP